MAASYPTAAKTFTTRNAGDTIQPAHVNDLQDEVAAIEDGLLNGSAPLNSSNSTVANLSVPGASTFTGNVTMNGTLTATKIISTSLVGAAGVTSYIRAYAGSPAEFATDSTMTKLALSERVIDLSSEFDSTTYTFTPKSSGYYQITARARCITAALGVIYAGIWVNDTLAAEGTAIEGAAETYGTPNVAVTLNLSSGAAGSVQFRAYAGSTGRMSSGVYTAMEILKVF